ncbi:MAG: sulfur carrier protein ThiS [Gemmatimonadales bacterium]
MTEASSSETIIISLNGEERVVPAGLTVSGLLAHLGLHERLVVVELNREILRRGRYKEVPVSAGDAIELVQFVGGG